MVQVQAARASEENRLARLNTHRAVTLFIGVGEPAGKRFQNVSNSLGEMLPGISVGVFKVQHHARRAGVEHFHDEFGIVRRASHLVALVGAPFRQRDFPRLHGRNGGRQEIGLLAGVRFVQGRFAAGDQHALAQRERGVQRREELRKARWQVARGVEAGRGGVYGHQPVGDCGRRNREPGFGAGCGHQFVLATDSLESVAAVSLHKRQLRGQRRAAAIPLTCS